MKKPEITEKSRNTVINGLTIIMTFIEKKEKHSYLKLWLQVTEGKIRIFFLKKYILDGVKLLYRLVFCHLIQ